MRKISLRSRTKEGLSMQAQLNNQKRLKIAVTEIRLHKPLTDENVAKNTNSSSTFWKWLTSIRLTPTTKFQIIILSYWFKFI
jgi:hypothetical protein